LATHDQPAVMAERMDPAEIPGPPSSDTNQSSSGLFQRLITGNLEKIIQGVVPYIAALPESLPRLYGQDSILNALHDMKTYNSTLPHPLLPSMWLYLTKQHYKTKLFTIGVFGRHKAGKSTLINALLHRIILPSATENETAFIVKIAHDPTKHYTKCPSTSDSCENCPEYYFNGSFVPQSGKKLNTCMLIKADNKKAREGTFPIHDFDGYVKACIPSFMEHTESFTNNINVMLLDTPGLAEANTAGFTKMSEYYLMTCSAYIYVISCTQLQDEVDQETLKAIITRDPDVFKDKRLIIAVTRFDVYESKDIGDDDGDGVDDGDGENYDNNMKLMSSIQAVKESIIRQCADIGIDIPEDCIVPVSARAALETRAQIKKKSSLSCTQMSVKFDLKNDRMVEASQIPIIEERIGDILKSIQHTWKTTITKDCLRYLQMMHGKLRSTQHHCQTNRQEIAKKVSAKKAQHQKIKTLKKEMEEAVQSIKKELSTAFDEDIKSQDKLIYKLIDQKWKEFAEQIKGRKMTLSEYHLELERLVAESNEYLKKSFCEFEFKNLDRIIFTFQVNLSGSRSQFISCYEEYCEVDKEDFKKIKNKPADLESIIEDVSKQIENEADDQSPPLTFEDLLMKTGTIEHNVIKQIWKKIKE
jgi:GTPase SAR1 family protein